MVMNGKIQESTKLLNNLLSTNFDYRNIKPEIYQKIIDSHEFEIIQKILISQLKQCISVKEFFISLIVAYICKKENINLYF